MSRKKARFIFPSFLRASHAATLLRHAAGCLLSVAFPSSCSLCRRELTEINLTGVCSACWAALEPWRGPVCICCGLPMASSRAAEASVLVCPDCRAGELPFDCARSFGVYRDSLRAAILLLKFQRRERWGMKLGSLLASVYENLEESRPAGPALVVPVPLHSVRERQRGYNQAALLALSLVRAVEKSHSSADLKLDCEALKKVRATPPQTGLSLAARHENVRGAFAVPRPERICDQVILLVDDVMTTGATLAACASVLKRAGAREVLGVTLARATPQFPDSASHRDRASVDEFELQRP